MFTSNSFLSNDILIYKRCVKVSGALKTTDKVYNAAAKLQLEYLRHMIFHSYLLGRNCLANRH